jgi:hypothetical protein
MTTEELRNIIVENGYADWAVAKSVTVNYPLIGFSTELKGLTSVYEFLSQQVEGFNKYGTIPRELKTIGQEYQRLKQEIELYINRKDFSDHWWNSIIRNQINNAQPPKLLHDSAETEFLINVQASTPEYFQAAYEYITQPSLSNISNKTYMTGYLMAYEFKNLDQSKIVKRKEAERKSLEKIKNEFSKYITESEANLLRYLDQNQKKTEENAAGIKKYLEEAKKSYDSWFGTTTNEFYGFSMNSEERMKEWEKVYREKLKLEAPAQYWNQRAKKLRKEGWGWLIGLILSSAVAVGILIWVLNEIALGTLGKIFADTGTAVKWSVIMITLVSFLAFLIRTFSKLTFSSFHLVRDAEEREQLTFVYLAMQKENKIDPTERHLIMQSLFSRADSGLLKDDGGPTMPGNIIDQAMKNR